MNVYFWFDNISILSYFKTFYSLTNFLNVMYLILAKITWDAIRLLFMHSAYYVQPVYK